ncbi:MAG TPA: O-antigen ligase family protein [Capsulimonadaceae bacterium]|jgi:O-antigen ligase
MVIFVPLILLALIVILAAINPLFAVVAGVIVIATVLVLRKPTEWLAITFAAGLLPQSVLGGESALSISLSDCLALLLLLIFAISAAMRKVRPNMGPIFLPILLFIAACALSSIANWRGNGTIVQVIRIVEFTFVLPIIYSAFVRTPAQVDRCFGMMLVLVTFLGMIGILGFASGSTHGLFLLGMHKNAFGPLLAVGAVVSLAYIRSQDLTERQKRWLIATCLICSMATVFSLSRGAWMGAIGGFLVILSMRRDWKGVFLLLGIAIPIVAACWSLLPKESAEYAGDISLHAHTMQFRLDKQENILQLWQSSPWLGIGVGYIKTENPENVYVQTLGETGIIGTIAFVIMLASVYVFMAKTYRLAMNKATRSLVTARLTLACAGVFTIPIVQGIVDAYWRRGVVFLSWAAVGMALSLYAYMRQSQSVKQPTVSRPERYAIRRVAKSPTLP